MGWGGGFDADRHQDAHPLLQSVYRFLLPKLSEYLDKVVLVVFIENPAGEGFPEHEFALFVANTPFPLAARVLRSWIEGMRREGKA
jgi:hypothetical protein